MLLHQKLFVYWGSGSHDHFEADMQHSQFTTHQQRWWIKETRYNEEIFLRQWRGRKNAVLLVSFRSATMNKPNCTNNYLSYHQQLELNRKNLMFLRLEKTVVTRQKRHLVYSVTHSKDMIHFNNGTVYS